MSLITDANFLIHEMRIKLLRTDERGERIVSFRPTVMSDDYIRLAAPTYPEMQYCYSPTYDNFFTKGSTNGSGTNLISSPRTKRSHYRLRKKENNMHPLNSPVVPKPATTPESGNEETDGDLGTNKPLPPIPMRKQSAPTLCVTEASKSLRPRFADDAPTAATPTTGTATTATSLHKETVIRSHTRTTSSTTFSFHTTAGSENAMVTSLHPSIESPIDPSPRSSLDVDNDQASFPLNEEIASEKESSKVKSIDSRQQHHNQKQLEPSELQKLREASQYEQEEEEQQYSPLEYTKIQIPPLYNKIEDLPKPTVPVANNTSNGTTTALPPVVATTGVATSTTTTNNNSMMPPLKLAPNLPTAHRRRRYPRQQLQQQSQTPSPSPSQQLPSQQVQQVQQQPAAAATPGSQQRQQIRRPPKSNLTAMIAERASAADNPFNEFSFVSGRGEAKPITLCVYLPHSIQPYEPISLVVRPDAIVDDVIGYILYDYVEKKRKPSLQEEMYDIAQWVLRIAEDDGEIEDDIPALDRTRQISMVSFAQFALCRTAPSQVKQNEMIRAKLGRTGPDHSSKTSKSSQQDNSHQLTVPPTTTSTARSSTTTANNIPASSTTVDIGPLDPVTAASTLASQQEADSSAVAVPIPSSKAMLTKSTMPMTPVKYFRIRLMTNEEVSATTTIPVYAEMFIGDVLELLSRKRKLDPDEHMLTIADSNVIVPNDTTVDSMGGVTELCLMKKGAGLTVSSSTHIWRSPNRKKKDELYYPNMYNTSSSAGGNNGILSQYKKYFVNRKMPMFVGRRESVIAIDGDYIHIMPPEHKGMFDSVKTTSFHVNAVISCKQSKKAPANFKITVLKDQSHKAYDFEAMNGKEAQEICARINFLMQVCKAS
ncbi:stress-activated map kinase interacting protein 1-domain-containing protein [Circinella umbellata]|nr:stress-activated map kinase interacting protein 1-domain-containing protein [Circinella umbellata]